MSGARQGFFFSSCYCASKPTAEPTREGFARKRGAGLAADNDGVAYGGLPCLGSRDDLSTFGAALSVSGLHLCGLDCGTVHAHPRSGLLLRRDAPSKPQKNNNN
jgi:hypothetical protein